MITETKKTPFEVYAELTPNPNSMKFVANVMLLEGGTVEYMSKEEALNCPIALQLFDFTGVKKVFITSNFITITKENDLDWYDITNILREFIRGYLASGEQLFIGSPFDANHIVAVKKVAVAGEKAAVKIVATAGEEAAVKKVAVAVNEKIEEINSLPDPEAEKQIIQLLDEYVKPAVEGDGGAIHFQSYVNGVVSVVLKGSCSGCPSSTITLKSGIENLLKRMVPGVKEVVAIND